MQTGSFLRGRAARALWLLEADTTFLNHGSFGATPRTVLAAQDDVRLQMERQPVRFFTSEAPVLLRASAERLGAFLGAEGRDLAFVENATTGVNAVVRSLALQPGDELLTTAYVYGAVRQCLQEAARTWGAKVIEAPTPFPLSDESEVIRAVEGCFSARTRLFVVDHLCSMSALHLPVQTLVALANERGIPVLIDGAHAPGMLELDVPSLGAHWYTGNCHKWLCAAKGTAFLWARRGVAQDALHAHITSHNRGQAFPAEFDWTGTRDLSAWCSIGAALDHHDRLGGATLRADNRALALTGAHHIAERWGRSLPAEDRFFGSIVPIEAPDAFVVDEHGAKALHDALLHRFRIEVPVYVFQGRLWLRVSAQAYNEFNEYEALAAAVLALR